MHQQNDEDHQIPIACLLSGAELARRGEEVAELFKEVDQIRELTDGYAFRFPGNNSVATSLFDFTLVERSCCPFFTFELAFDPQEGPIWLRLRGGAGVKEFVASTFLQLEQE